MTVKASPLHGIVFESGLLDALSHIRMTSETEFIPRSQEIKLVIRTMRIMA